jgi:uncharacterized protein with GYD domain
MSLFFVQHKHDAEICPAKDPAQGSMLLAHISPSNARSFGIDIRGDAVLDGQHTFMLILEAENQAQIEDFMLPFKEAGNVDIWPASTCETVVSREGC